LLHVIAWLAVELRYETTWYLISDRALRLRRGIWLIRETTISFENIQNVSTQQGPLQRFLGIADVIVETAGGGGGSSQGLPGSSHLGRIEGVADAAAIRDTIRLHVGRSPTAGLGDEAFARSEAVPWGDPAELELLRDIRNLARRMAKDQEPPG
jgi:hypothetical protein